MVSQDAWFDVLSGEIIKVLQAILRKATSCAQNTAGELMLEKV